MVVSHSAGVLGALLLAAVGPVAQCARYARCPRPAPWLPQVVGPVQWESTIKTLLERGLEESYEIGPNKVIAGAPGWPQWL